MSDTTLTNEEPAKALVAILIAVAILFVAFILLRPRIARADILKEGDIAPPITTQMVTGDQVAPFSLADYRGKKVILYFYPKDDTPGCTKEACAFRDGFAQFRNAGLTVLGCSVDSSDAHRAFIKKYNLPFSLLLDPDRKIATNYGAANGIPILGLDKRITYVIDEDGRIFKVYPNVDPSQHATQILADMPPPPTPTATAVATPSASVGNNSSKSSDDSGDSGDTKGNDDSPKD
ncbi:MAG TPA: peroxiredoxin [Candidatus Binataceae bacterium]|nr:peroxiredoxin [Candidatus Binataceae bacterium]